MKHPMLVLGLGWLIGTGPFLCAANGGPAPVDLPAADHSPQKDDLNRTIFSLIKEKDIDRINNFLDQFPSATGDRAANRDYPLHVAVETGDSKIVAALIDRGAPLEQRDARLATPLILAAKQQDVETATVLLNAGAKVDVKDTNKFTPLYYAVLTKNAAMVKLLKEKNADIDIAESQNGLTPVHLAINQGQLDVAVDLMAAKFTETAYRPFYLMEKDDPAKFQSELLAQPKLMDMRIAGGWSLLHHAVARGRTDYLVFLLDHGMDTLSRDCALRCPLHYAAEAGNLDYVKRLLEKRGDTAPDPNGWDENKITPLMLAVQNGHLEVCKLLLASGANPNIINADGKNLAFALATCDQPLADLLAPYPMDMNLRDSSGCTPLYYAVGNIQRMNLLLKQGAKTDVVDNAGRTPLHAAAEVGSLEAVKLLLSQGAPLDALDRTSKRTPLHLAAINGHFQVVNYLLEKGANFELTDSIGNTVMHFAVDDVTTLMTLLKHHARIDVLTTQTKLTPLLAAKIAKKTDAQVILQAYLDAHAAAKDGKVEALQALFPQLNAARDEALKNNNEALAAALTAIPGSLIESRDHDGATPLLLAAEGGHVPMATYLFQCGADAKAVRMDGKTGLHLAAAGNHGAMIGLLLQKQCDVAATDAQQQTALHVAAANNAVDAAKVLIAAKASLDAVDKDGKTPLQVAQAANQKEVAELLAAGQ